MGTVTDPIKGNYNIISEPILLLKEWCKNNWYNNIPFSFPQNGYFTNKFAIRDLQTFHHCANHARIDQVSVHNNNYSQFFFVSIVFSVSLLPFIKAFLQKFLTQCVSWTTVYMPTHQILSSLWLYEYVLTGCHSSVTTCKITRFIYFKQTDKFIPPPDALDSSAVVNYFSNRCSKSCLQLQKVFWHQLI